MRIYVALMVFATLASTAAAQEQSARVTADDGVAGVNLAGRLDVSRLDVAVMLTEAQAPVARQTAPTLVPVRRRRGSMVGYIEDATVESKLRVRFDTSFHNRVPDRAEFFYGKCGCYKGVPPPNLDSEAPGPAGAANDVNFQQLDAWGEYAVGHGFSIFGQLPVRWLQPKSFLFNTFFEDKSGLSDVRAGARFGLASSEEQSVTVQAQFFLPTGDAGNAMGTNHASFEPELLYFRQVSDVVTLESQFGVWIPIGGSAGVPTTVDENFSGSVLNYGIGSGFDLLRRTGLRFGPVVELVGWRVLGGFQTAEAPAPANADGINVVNLKIGGRVTINDRDSVYVGWGHHLTDNTWYEDIVRFEYRRSF